MAYSFADVAKSVDASDLGSDVIGRVGSNPTICTKCHKALVLLNWVWRSW